jgi:hypothetical protein
VSAKRLLEVLGGAALQQQQLTAGLTAVQQRHSAPPPADPLPASCAAAVFRPQYCTNRKHLKPLWFCIVSCHLLWFTFTKAIFNVLWKKITRKTVVFKSTKKKGEEDGRDGKKKRRFCAPPANVGDMEGTLDAWVLVASFSISFTTAVVGAFQMIDKPYTAQGDFRWFLALSIFWSIYNMIPPALFIFYCYNKGQLFEDFCSFCMTLSFLMGIGGIVCTWLVPGAWLCDGWLPGWRWLHGWPVAVGRGSAAAARKQAGGRHS